MRVARRITATSHSYYAIHTHSRRVRGEFISSFVRICASLQEKEKNKNCQVSSTVAARCSRSLNIIEGLLLYLAQHCCCFSYSDFLFFLSFFLVLKLRTCTTRKRDLLSTMYIEATIRIYAADQQQQQQPNFAKKEKAGYA